MQNSNSELKHSGFVAIVGLPNAGKSTFLNTVLRTKISIVSPKAQTTRNKIRGVYTGEDYQVVFTDTPGITPNDFGKLLNNWMNKYSFSAAKDSDLILFFVDVSSQHPELGVGDEEKTILKRLSGQKVILVVNKVDSVKKMRADDTVAVYNKFFPFLSSHIISATEGVGTGLLINDILAHLPPGPKYFPDDFVSDQEDEFLISEIIREKLFLLLKQEIPYSTTVTVESLRNHKTKDLVLIDATIHVSRASQKGIVIGSNGRTLGRIGKMARTELEEVYGKQVGLKIFVRIEEKWYEKENLLKKVGFTKDFED